MESLARLTYNVERRAQARARDQERKRKRAHGDTEPSHPREKRLHAGAKAKAKRSRQLPGDVGEVAQQSLATEIEGTGGYGPGSLRFSSTAAIHSLPGISKGTRQRLSYISDKDFMANMLEAMYVYDEKTGWWNPREGEQEPRR